MKKKVVEVLKRHGVYYFFPATHGYGRSGVPDIICCVAGQFIAIECKAEGGEPTELQNREIRRIYNNGGKTFVIGQFSPGHTEYELQELEGVIKLLKAAGNPT